MKLNKNSWHVHLNDYVYGEGYSHSQTNGCPYFWLSIIAVLISPAVFFSRSIGNTMSRGTKDFVSEYGIGLFWIGLSIVMLVLGVNVWITWFLIGVVYSCVMFALNNGLGDIIYRWSVNRQKPYKAKPKKEKKPHMTVEMAKAWKNKHCPVIEWVD